MTKAAAIVLSMFCASCTTPSDSPQYSGKSVSLCSLVADEKGNAGQQVLVHGLLAQTPHGREIYSPECQISADLRGSSDFWEKRSKAIVDAAFANNELARVPVVVAGVFQPSTRYENGKPVINVGGHFIEQGRIVAARQP